VIEDEGIPCDGEVISKRYFAKVKSQFLQDMLDDSSNNIVGPGSKKHKVYMRKCRIFFSIFDFENS
jgi:hypothetical protein